MRREVSRLCWAVTGTVPRGARTRSILGGNPVRGPVVSWIAALFEKPTIYVKETTRHNYTHFVMPAPDPAPVGERYYIFFRPVRENYGYTLIVESAYCMATPPETRSGILFGAMFEKVMN
jgi:hypothetical protein